LGVWPVSAATCWCISLPRTYRWMSLSTSVFSRWICAAFRSGVWPQFFSCCSRVRWRVGCLPPISQRCERPRVGESFGGHTRPAACLRNCLCRPGGENPEHHFIVRYCQRHQQLHGRALAEHRRGAFLKPVSGDVELGGGELWHIPLDEIARATRRFDAHSLNARDPIAPRASGVSLSARAPTSRPSSRGKGRRASAKHERGLPPTLLG
jgi:hypothetical protein